MSRTLAAFLLAAASVGALSSANATSLEFFATGDYYLRSGIEDDIEEDNGEAVDSSAGAADGEVTTSNGVGGRVGLRVPFADDRIDLGASFSYIKGPEVESKLTTSLGGVVQNTETYFSRVMAEAGFRIPLSEKVHLRIGGGAGMARVRVENEVDGTGLFAIAESGTEEEDGFTWEVSPALVMLLGKIDLELGVRYAQFPTVDESDDTPRIEWKPLGFYLGVAF